MQANAHSLKAVVTILWVVRADVEFRKEAREVLSLGFGTIASLSGLRDQCQEGNEGQVTQLRAYYWATA